MIGAGDTVIQQAKIYEDATETEPRSEALGRIEAVIGAGEMEQALREGRCLRLDDAVELALSLTALERAADQHE